MLRKFTVENFKSFKDKITFDLSNPSNYSFNESSVRNGIVNNGAIFGINGIGKSNFGLALFDIVNTLTDKYKQFNFYDNFINLNTNKPFAFFEYEFLFDNSILIYKYSKRDVNELVSESLSIDGKELIYYDFRENKGFSTIRGSENLILNMKSLNSRVKYILNTNLLSDNDHVSKILLQFKDFVDRMLLFYSLRDNNFIGYADKGESLSSIIIKKNKVKEFEDLLNSQGLNLEVVGAKTVDGRDELLIKYKNGFANFFKVCSTGMSALALFFSWLIELENCSLVYIDEFDAFYHYELAEKIIEIIKKHKKTQIFVSTHNTDLLSNDLLRPDCYYILTCDKLESLNKCTEKELRLAHNLQKMFKAGAFTDR